jgi:hypothetical protein
MINQKTERKLKKEEFKEAYRYYRKKQKECDYGSWYAAEWVSEIRPIPAYYDKLETRKFIKEKYIREKRGDDFVDSLKFLITYE